MRCIDNLEKLRTGFNVIVMNPSGRGGEKETKKRKESKKGEKKKSEKRKKKPAA